jgi:hypothetical protein
LVHRIDVIELPQLAQEPHYPSLNLGFGSGLIALGLDMVFAFADSAVLIFATFVIHT